jgi:hypothetical protein
MQVTAPQFLLTSWLLDKCKTQTLQGEKFVFCKVQNINILTEIAAQKRFTAPVSPRLFGCRSFHQVFY